MMVDNRQILFSHGRNLKKHQNKEKNVHISKFLRTREEKQLKLGNSCHGNNRLFQEVLRALCLTSYLTNLNI